MRSWSVLIIAFASTGKKGKMMQQALVLTILLLPVRGSESCKVRLSTYTRRKYCEVLPSAFTAVRLFAREGSCRTCQWTILSVPLQQCEHVLPHNTRI